MTDLDERALTLGRLLSLEAADFAIPRGSLERIRQRARQRRQRRRGGVGVISATAALGGLALLPANDGSRTVVPTDSTASSAPPPTTAGTSDTLRRTAEVTLAQQRLRELGFDPGQPDGIIGPLTEQAIWAFEGIVLGRPWQQQTGRLDDTVMAGLFDPGTAITPRRSGLANHTEIHLDLQVLVVFHGDEPVLVTHISSGSGASWCDRTTYDADDTGTRLPEPVTKDLCGVANTPGGVFEYYHRVDGDAITPLGGMHNPVFFNYGIAVHGAVNVPREPVSRGAIRIPMHIADSFPSLVANGDDVYVWDGVKEPEDQSIEERLPSFMYPDPDAGTTPD